MNRVALKTAIHKSARRSLPPLADVAAVVLACYDRLYPRSAPLSLVRVLNPSRGAKRLHDAVMELYCFVAGRIGVDL